MNKDALEKIERLKSGSSEYARIHYWLKKNYGQTKICESETCKGLSKIYDWSLKQGKHHEKKRENYWRLCRQCHILYDWTDERTEELKTHTNDLECRNGHPRTPENTFFYKDIRGCLICYETWKKQHRSYSHQYSLDNREYTREYKKQYYLKSLFINPQV